MLTKPACDVVFCLLVAGPREYGVRPVSLNEAAHIEERGEVGNTGGLLHVVRHDDDGEIPAQLAYTLLDFLGGWGRERWRVRP